MKNFLNDEDYHYYDPMKIATACVYLGAKATDKQRSLRDTLTTFDRIQAKNRNKAKVENSPVLHLWRKPTGQLCVYDESRNKGRGNDANDLHKSKIQTVIRAVGDKKIQGT